MIKSAFFIVSLMACVLLTGCQSKKQSDLAVEYSGEVLIAGKVLNQEVYPLERELTLIIPFFDKMESMYRVPIQEDGSFSFSFPVCANIREVSIRNYVEHLYVQPGDSLYIEIDFKDLFHPKVIGDAEKLNQEILAFTENAYYYIHNYAIEPNLKFEDFEAEMKKEYALRLERRKEYLQKFQPMQDVILLTEELLKQDYYYAYIFHANQYQFKTKEQIDRYHALLPEINKLYNKGILSARLFYIAEVVGTYISYGIAYKDRKHPSIEEVMAVVGENSLNQYLYAKGIATSLKSNDTLLLTERFAQFDSIVVMPHLRNQIMQIYSQTKTYLENPQFVSDNLLYGKLNESSGIKNPMKHMEAIYAILEKQKGKVVYFDFWARWCPPCLKEMEPLKKLRTQYSTEDLIIYSVCVSDSKKEWKECLDKYSLTNIGIECIQVDYFGENNYSKIAKQWKIQSLPYGVLINRKGQIIDFGSAVRPSNPLLLNRIDEAVKGLK